MWRARRNEHTLGWILIALGVGSIVSLLLASSAADDVREQLSSSMREGARAARQRSREAVETVSDLADRGRDQAKEIVDKGRDIAANARSQAKDYAEQGHAAIRQQINNL